MRTVRLAVFGAGGMAQVAHIPAWKKISDVNLVAVCDPNLARAKAVAERFSIPHYFADDEQVLKLEEVDAVDICAPTNMHMTLAINALSAGKHVLVEKPMSRTAGEAERMVEAARTTKRKLMVAMNLRFRRDSLNLKSFVESGEVGEILYAKCGWLRRQESWSERLWVYQKQLSGGGVFMDLGIQMLDLTLWLLGNQKARSVKASIFNKHAGVEVEDTALALVQLDDGSALTIEVSWTNVTAQDEVYADLFGTQGRASLNPLRVMKEMHGHAVNLISQGNEFPTVRYKRSHENELRHFIKCVQDDIPMLSTGEEGWERMRIIEAVYDSAKQMKEVEL